jgi:hypothetical protein
MTPLTLTLDTLTNGLDTPGSRDDAGDYAAMFIGVVLIAHDCNLQAHHRIVNPVELSMARPRCADSLGRRASEIFVLRLWPLINELNDNANHFALL